MHSERRKYRGPEFAVHIGTSVSPKTFYEIEKLTRELGVTRAEIVRCLVVRGLAEYGRDGELLEFADASLNGAVNQRESGTDNLNGAGVDNSHERVTQKTP